MFVIIEDKLTDWIENKSLKLYKILEKEYCDLVSEESILNALEEEYFTPDGKVFHGEIYKELETEKVA